MNKICVALLCSLICAAAVFPQAAADPVELSASVKNDYEPSGEYPFGRQNPEAPAETGQFGFMIGVFECVDEIRNPADGKWYKSKSVWSSAYFLNGFGIQDKYWSPISVASGTRIFDAKKGKWVVNYFQSQPGYGTGVWEGEKEGENMVMRQQTGPVESRLTFSGITKDSFNWIGERVEGEKISSGWKISCKRRKE